MAFPKVLCCVRGWVSVMDCSVMDPNAANQEVVWNDLYLHLAEGVADFRGVAGNKYWLGSVKCLQF